MSDELLAALTQALNQGMHYSPTTIQQQALQEHFNSLHVSHEKLKTTFAHVQKELEEQRTQIQELQKNQNQNKGGLSVIYIGLTFIGTLLGGAMSWILNK